MAMTFVEPALVEFDGNPLTDHNRSALQEGQERIEHQTRLASGRMVSYFVADKKTFRMSWDMLPEADENTVDGFWGAASIHNHYRTTPGSFEITVVNKDGTTDNYEVMYSAFSRTLQKRWDDRYWSITLAVEEV